MRDRSRALRAAPTIAIRSAYRGVVLTVEGVLGRAGDELVTEAIGAALVAVQGAHRIHVDVTRAEPISPGLAQELRRLERSGARITGLPSLAPAGRAR